MNYRINTKNPQDWDGEFVVNKTEKAEIEAHADQLDKDFYNNYSFEETDQIETSAVSDWNWLDLFPAVKECTRATYNLYGIKQEYRRLEMDDDTTMSDIFAEAWQEVYLDKYGYVEIDMDIITADHYANELAQRYEIAVREKLEAASNALDWEMMQNDAEASFEAQVKEYEASKRLYTIDPDSKRVRDADGIPVLFAFCDSEEIDDVQKYEGELQDLIAEKLGNPETIYIQLEAVEDGYRVYADSEPISF